MVDRTDEALLEELGISLDAPARPARTAREERIIAGLEDIQRFVQQHGRWPSHGEDKDIFERLYAVRLEKIRSSEECRAVLADSDPQGLLNREAASPITQPETLDDDALLSELGVAASSETDITTLTHVKPRAEIQAAEEVAQRMPCRDFAVFKPLFAKIQEDLKSGIRKTREFKQHAQINQGEFFILGGQKAYVAHVGEEIKAPNGDADARLRVIFDNGTESDLLRRSLQRALYKDEMGRRISNPAAGPLFSDTVEDDDQSSGTIYVLRSLSDHPYVQQHRDVIHKIGVTSGDIRRRIANAKLDPTFLMAEVEVVATYELVNINRTRLENLIHRFFAPARLAIEINDRFGNPVVPREWFLMPIFIVDQAVERLRDGSISNFRYDSEKVQIIRA